jgi:hypothetical protein
MENLNTMEMSALLDLLAEQTVKYSQMMSEGTTDGEYEKCRQVIDAIQKEIVDRKLSFKDNSTTSASPSEFEQ